LNTGNKQGKAHTFYIKNTGDTTMNDTVLIAIISATAALLSAVLTGVITGGKTIYRIDQLEKKVEKHNSLVERMVTVEQSCKSAHYRIDGMEGGK
jgi:archaellum component FlaG (FlaF/FlaG flagellin family)